MNYAWVEEDIVTNLVWMLPASASDFPNVIPCGEYMVHIGDTYKDGVFYRGEERVRTKEEYLDAHYGAIIAELDAALLDATYENIVGGLE